MSERVIGGAAFVGAPPKRPIFEDPEFGVDEDGNPLSLEAWLIRQQGA